MVNLPVSLENIEVIIDEVFAIVRLQKEMEEDYPEVTLSAAWYKLHGIEKLVEAVEQFIDDKKMIAECYEIREALSEAMLEIEVLAEQVMFKEGTEIKICCASPRIGEIRN